jgi:hypothetical protein
LVECASALTHSSLLLLTEGKDEAELAQPLDPVADTPLLLEGDDPLEDDDAPGHPWQSP